MKALRMLAAAAAMCAIASGPALALEDGDLSGVWEGAFWGEEQTPTTFQATLRDTAGTGFSGSTVELNNFGEDYTPFLLAIVIGDVRGNVIRFTKTYDGTSGVSHSVAYEGRIVSDRRIVGTWTSGGLTGEFELAR